MTKKIIALLLALTMTLGLSASAFATAADTSEATSKTDTSIVLVTPDAITTVFSDEDADGVSVADATESVTIDSVTYSYTFEEQEDNPALSDVTLDFTVKTGAQEYPAAATGTVSAYPLSSGDTLWEGPIEGYATINGIEHLFIVGFAKLDSSDAMQAGVTVQAVDEANATDPATFIFGEPVITDAIEHELNDQASMVQEEELSEKINGQAELCSSSSYAFTYVGMANSYFDINSISGNYSQRSYAYFCTITDCFAVAIKSYCSTLENYYKRTGNAYTYIDSFSVQLEREDCATNRKSYIVGVESFKFDTDNFGSGTTLIKPLFEDAMSYLNVPTSTISAVLDGLKGSVSKDENTDVASVDVSFGLYQCADFDDSGVGVPIVFQLGRTPSSSYIGDSPYKFTTSIKYRTQYQASGYGLWVYLYTSAYSAYKSVDIDIT